MLENSYKPQELLSDVVLDLYVCGLENNKENINLLKQLKTMSEKIPSKHIENNYKQARLEQYFYYRRVAKEREPHMIERLKKDMQKIRGGAGDVNYYNGRGGGMKPILDACCGAKIFWFDKKNPNVLFCDKRVVPYHEYYKNRYIEIKPDIICDFTNLPFPDKSFKLVVFDPPHLTRAGKTSWMALKYGCLEDDWPQMLHDGFWECMRVLDDYGTLIFKWSEVQIPLKQVLDAIKAEPLFGHRSGKHNNTHWMAFMKFPKEVEA